MRTQFLALLAIAVALSGCAPPSATNSQSIATGPTTDVVKRQDLVGYAFFDGKLVVPTSAQAAAFSPYDTPIVSVSTEPGKYVDRGEPIVKLQIPGADEATNMAKADVSSAKASLSDQKASQSGPVKDAQKALDDARAAEKAAQDTVASGGTADVAAATQARIDAQAALDQAKRQLNQQLQPSKDAVSQSAAQLAAIKADAQKGIVRAPISGTVVTLDAKPGMMAKSNQTLATIIDFERSRVQGTVPPELKDLVKKDTDVIIALTGSSANPLDGRVVDVTVIPPSAGQTSPGYLAVIEFTRPRSIVQPSIGIKRIGVRTGSVKDVLVVPVGAVSTKDGKSIVSVQNGSEWIDVIVETGITDGALVEIKSGLTEGAVVRVQPTNAS